MKTSNKFDYRSSCRLLKAAIGVCTLIATQALYASPSVQLQYVSRFGKAASTAPGEMNYPSGVAVDNSNGDLYVMDTLNHRIQKFDSNGNFITLWQSLNGLGISIDPTNRDVYVAAPASNQVRKYDSNGTLLLEWGTGGTGPGQFKSPRDVAVHPITRDVFVLDENNARVQVFNSNGVYQYEFPGQFHKPYALTIESSGTFVYVANSGGCNIQKFDLQGGLLATWGSIGSAQGEFRWPRGIDTDANGNIFVADADMERLQILNTSGVSVQVIQGPHNLQEGPFHPRDVSVDKRNGDYYAAAAYAFRVDKFDANGNYLWSIGHWDKDGSFLNLPKGIAVDPTTNDIIVADTFNHMVKRFSSEGVFISQHGASAPIDRTSLFLGFPHRIDVNYLGNIVGINEGIYYEDDLTWGSDQYVRIFDPFYNFLSGIAYEDFYAGMYGLDTAQDSDDVFVALTNKNKVAKFDGNANLIFEVGDKGPEPGNFDKPAGIAEDKVTGGFYVVDSGNQRIQKFSKTGAFLFAWGSGGELDGEFKLTSISDIDVDADGLVYVADTGNNRIQVFDYDGTHLASLGIKGWGGPGQFAWPASLAVTPGNRVYILDTGGKEIEIYNIVKTGVIDRDLDTIADIWEFKYFASLNRDGSGDFDLDGLTDLEEFNLGTSPDNTDSDGDQMTDGWEQTAGLDPTIADGDIDSDGDGFSNLEEFLAGTDPNDPNSIPAGLLLTSGTMNIQGASYSNISLATTIPDPIVIVGPATTTSADPGIVAIRNVTPDGFAATFKEWNYQNGNHPTEQAHFTVWREGRYTMADGTVVEAGYFDTDGTLTTHTASFSQAFAGAPHVFLTPQTTNGQDTMVLRAINITGSGFDVVLQEQESKNDGSHISERIGYLAIYQPSLAGDIVAGGNSYSFSLASMQLSDTPQSASSTLMLKLEEERSADYETWHIAEQVQTLAIGQQLYTQVTSSQGADPVNIRALVSTNATSPVLVSGVVSSLSTGFVFNQAYQNPVVIAGVSSRFENDPGVVRVHKVTGSGFSALFDEWNYLDKVHTQETVSFLVAEAGRTTQADGTVIEAGKFDVDGNGAFISVDFQQAFASVPQVFLTAQTKAGKDPVYVRARNITSTGFEAAIFEEELLTDGHVFEVIGYIAIVPAAGTVELSSSGGIVAGSLSKQNVSNTPVVISGTTEVFLQEDASADAELSHVVESLDILHYNGAVFAQPITFNGADPFVPRLN